MQTKQLRGSAMLLGTPFRPWLTEPAGGTPLNARRSLAKLYAYGFQPTLGAGYSDSIDNLLNPSPAGSFLDLFLTFNLAADTSVYNTNLWGGGGRLVDWTCVGHRVDPASTLYCKLAAITRRHAIMSQHTAVSSEVGHQYTWIAADGTRAVRTITGVASYISADSANDSFHIVYLNADLPTTINTAPILADRATNLVGLPTAKTNQFRQVLVSNILANSDGSLLFISPDGGLRQTYYGDWVGGDSGSPAFVIVGAQPIYCTSAVWGSYGGGGPNAAWRAGWLVDACQRLDTAGTGYLPVLYNVQLTAARRAATRRSLA